MNLDEVMNDGIYIEGFDGMSDIIIFNRNGNWYDLMKVMPKAMGRYNSIIDEYGILAICCDLTPPSVIKGLLRRKVTHTVSQEALRKLYDGIDRLEGWKYEVRPFNFEKFWFNGTPLYGVTLMLKYFEIYARTRDKYYHDGDRCYKRMHDNYMKLFMSHAGKYYLKERKKELRKIKASRF